MVFFLLFLLFLLHSISFFFMSLLNPTQNIRSCCTGVAAEICQVTGTSVKLIELISCTRTCWNHLTSLLSISTVEKSISVPAGLLVYSCFICILGKAEEGEGKRWKRSDSYLMNCWKNMNHLMRSYPVQCNSPLSCAKALWSKRDATSPCVFALGTDVCLHAASFLRCAIVEGFCNDRWQGGMKRRRGLEMGKKPGDQW